ncbi:MAG: hypothetical protein RL338_85 [Chloroflexota bacterium]
MLDLTDDRGRRAAERLGHELIGWLTTVDADGRPQSSPIWFIWDGAELAIRSLERTPRVRNLRANPHVSFHLDSDGLGGEIVTAEGVARLDPAGLTAEETAAYRSKYDPRMREYGWAWDWFDREYPVVVRLRPTRFRLG